MVHRIVASPHSRVQYFWRTFCIYFVLMCLFSLALDWLLDEPREESYAGYAVIFAFFSAFIAWLSVRSWVRYGWFSPQPRECFLTMVEEGLLIEVPSRGLSFYQPWTGLSYRRSADMLLLFTNGALYSIVSVKGLPGEKLAAILADMRRYTGQGQARHGLFAPEKAAAPFAAVPAGDELPPLPPAHVPPPISVLATSPVFYANTPTQWKEYLRLALRPDWVGCLFHLAVIAGLCFVGGVLVWTEDGGFAVFMFLFAFWLLCKLAYPGRRQRSIPGSVRMEVSRTELLERWENGAWARFRLPAEEAASLVLLPHVCCLRRRNELGDFVFDVDGELPPPLAAYRCEPAPRNRLRVVLGLLLALLSGALGYGVLAYLDEPSPVTRDFRAMGPQPSAATLRSFVETHFASAGTLCDTPQLEAVMNPESGEPEGYILTYTESEPDAEDGEEGVEGLGHIAWKTDVYFYPDGDVIDNESSPVSWCPCEECTSYRLMMLTEGE